MSSEGEKSLLYCCCTVIIRIFAELLRMLAMVIGYHEVTTYTYIEREGPPPQCMHIDFIEDWAWISVQRNFRVLRTSTV